MKKLMIAVAIVCAAAMTQAAAVAWTSAAMKDHTGTAIEKDATTYTATVAFYTYDAATGYTDVSSTFGGALSSDTAAKNGVYKGTTGTGITGDYYAQLVISGDGWEIKSDLDSGAFHYDASAYSDLTLNFQTGAGFATVADKLGNSGTNYGWQSVPEPTSGLLLLLGVAGLALRRRRA